MTTSQSKQYKEHYRRLLFSGGEHKFFQELFKMINNGEIEKCNILLNIFKTDGQMKQLAYPTENHGESALHVAAKSNQPLEIINKLIEVCPDLMLSDRRDSDDYYGQTALHIAIVQGNTDTVETILSELLNNRKTKIDHVLHRCATGRKFTNTVMMGELPLSVAALTFDQDMVSLLLQNGADMNRKNTKGDTVFHTLIRFSAIYPQLLHSVLEMFQFLHEQLKEMMDTTKNKNDFYITEYDHCDHFYIYFICNNEDLNPLQLCVFLAQPDIFQYLLNLQHVYCFLIDYDGLLDRKFYDVTEIDSLAMQKWLASHQTKINKMSRHVAPNDAEGVPNVKFSNQRMNVSFPFCGTWCTMDHKESILEMIFNIKTSSALEFIQISAVRNIIKTKWMYYRLFHYLWFLFHLLFMILLTVYAVFLAESYSKISTGSDTNSTLSAGTMALNSKNSNHDDFLAASSVIYLIIAILYLIIEIWHILRRWSSHHLSQLKNVLCNGPYRIVLFIFALSLVLDFILRKHVPHYEDYLLILALVTGWLYLTFFFRSWKKFSFFTVMLQKIIFGDLLRFTVIIGTTVISFTAGLYMVFKGAKIERGDFDTYSTTMLVLFKLMIGLADVEVLYEARHPWLAVILFLIFVVLTYILMMNALIAMMSQTCALVSENRYALWRIQQLALILFYEDILPRCISRMVGQEKHINRFDPKLKQVIKEQRYFLDLCSLRTEHDCTEETYFLKQKLKTESIAALTTLSSNFLLSNDTPIQISALNGIRHIGNTSLIQNNIKLRKRRLISAILEEDDVKDSKRSPKVEQKKSRAEKTHNPKNESIKNDLSNDIPKSYNLDGLPSKDDPKQNLTNKQFCPEGGMESSSKPVPVRINTSNLYLGRETPKHDGNILNSSPNKKHVDFTPFVTFHQESFLNPISGQYTMDKAEDYHTSVSQQNDVRMVSVEPKPLTQNCRSMKKVPSVEIGFVSEA